MQQLSNDTQPTHNKTKIIHGGVVAPARTTTTPDNHAKINTNTHTRPILK